MVRQCVLCVHMHMLNMRLRLRIIYSVSLQARIKLMIFSVTQCQGLIELRKRREGMQQPECRVGIAGKSYFHSFPRISSALLSACYKNSTCSFLAVSSAAIQLAASTWLLTSANKALIPNCRDGLLLAWLSELTLGVVLKRIGCRIARKKIHD